MSAQALRQGGSPERSRAQEIAVIGMAARYPGARNTRELWRNLVEGRDSIQEVPRERWDHSRWYDSNPDALNKSISRWGGFIAEVDRFDPLFFNISPLEAEWMDPQHRLFLEESWKAIEDAGYAAGALDGKRCGVFVGCKEGEYVQKLRGQELNAFTLSGNSAAILPARLSYFLNLRGASVPVDTACSSSLVAIHLACESIRSGACELAIAGGIALMLTARTHVVLGKAGILSPNGRCRTFDDSADGIVTGEGVGVVVLKPLERALADGDHIYGVIKGSGINQDGRTNGITAPSAPSQSALELEVYERAGINPETLGYVEAHGTGTPLGDPIELQALTESFRKYTDRRQFCAIGSIKTNFGHTMEASGVAGLIKVLLCLQNRRLVPSLHYTRSNRHLDFPSTPFFVNTELREWRTDGHPRRAALSSFGFSGTNAHVVIEEAPERASRSSMAARPLQLIPLSAHSEQALRQRMADLQAWLGEEGGGRSLEDVAFTLQVGRTHHPLRAAFIARDSGHLKELLGATLRGERPEALLMSPPGGQAAARREPALLKLGNTLLRGLREPMGAPEAQRRLAVVAGLYVKGYELDWAGSHGDNARRLPLPTHPFARDRYWMEGGPWDDASATVPSQPVSAPSERRDSAGAREEDLLSVLRRMITSLLKLPEEMLQPDEELMAFGFTSLIGARLIRRLEETHGVQISNAELLEAGTLRRLTDLVAQQLGVEATPRHAPPVERASDRLPQVDRAPAVMEVPEVSRHALSAGQTGLWLIQQLSPSGNAYNVPCAFRIRGELDLPALKAALGKLWARHPSLRARVVVNDAQPVQVITPGAEVPFEVHTLPADTSPEQERAFLARLGSAPFDLARDALARVHLVLKPGREPLFVLAAHHIIMDGSSLQLLVRDLEALYEAERTKRAPELVRLTASYADFVAWQTRMLESDDGRRHREYWRSRLLPEPPTLNLPTDRPRPPKRQLQGRTYATTLPMELLQDVRRLGASQRIYPFTLFLAAFKALLHRYTQQEDLLVGVPVAGRPRSEFEDVVGYFVNVLCLRSHVSADMSFLDYARSLQALHSEAQEHADFPFTEVVREVGGARNRGHVPLIQAQFVYQNWIAAGAKGGSRLGLEALLDLQQQGEFDLSLELVEVEGRSQVFFKYAPELFDAGTIERMASHYEVLLRSALREPRQRIGALELLGPVERYQLETEWRRTERPFPRERCVHELFEAQVQRSGGDVAITFGDRSLSYAELNERANRLAATLRQAGVGPDSIVAILAERSLELMVGLFGILKAGGAYLPIDPRYPADRIRYMLEDSKTRIVLVGDPRWAPEGFQGRVLDLNDPSTYTGDGSNPERRTRPDNLAYVIYTSGSTGRPKGAMLEHRGLVNRLKWMQNRYPLGRGDVILQKTPYTFDVSVWELFWWSLEGASLVLLAPGMEKDPRAVADAISRERVTVMHFVPSALSVFLEYVEALRDVSELSSLKQVFASGEALTVPQVSRFNALLHRRNGTRLANLYGPTEASIDVSYFDCSEQENHERIPIGRPIDNINLLVLSPERKPQPIGVPGELCIAGIGLARGYLNNPVLTAERFVAHPFAPGERLYRTGDLARWLPDGNLEYLGRLDRQVKVRGLRIELGEIEFALASLPGIRDAFVVAMTDAAGTGKDRLVAYWAGEPAQEYTLESLRRLLGQKLPDYMVPSAFVRLTKLPQTAHGKVDTRALPPPEQAVPEGGERRGEEPHSGLEGSIATILQQLIGGRRVGRKENFFDLGCHSLTLAQAAIRLSTVLGREVPVVTLFEHPTVEALARHLSPQEKGSVLAESARRGLRQRQMLAALAYRQDGSRG
jgi:amino acid adenylation domain-containing protein